MASHPSFARQSDNGYTFLLMVFLDIEQKMHDPFSKPFASVACSELLRRVSGFFVSCSLVEVEDDGLFTAV